MVNINDIKYLLFDLNHLEFINQPASEALDDDPDRQLIVVQVMDGHPALSGNTYIPEEIFNVYRSEDLFHRIVISGSNINLYDENDILINPGFLPLSGGNMSDFITLHADPIDDFHAATKRWVEDTISGSAQSGLISGAIADALGSTLQVNLTQGTNLLVTNSGLPLNNITAIINGQDYDLLSNGIGIKLPGLYTISWNVAAELAGSTATRRRNLTTQILLDNAVISGTTGGTYTRSSDTSPIVNIGGDYIIETTSLNQEVRIRTEDRSVETTNGITFTVFDGYLRAKLVRRGS